MIAQRTLPASMFASGNVRSHAVRAMQTEAAKRGLRYVPLSDVPSKFGAVDIAWRNANGDWLILRGRVLTLTARA